MPEGRRVKARGLLEPISGEVFTSQVEWYRGSSVSMSLSGIEAFFYFLENSSLTLKGLKNARRKKDD